MNTKNKMTITVCGSHGKLLVDAKTGVVLESPEQSEYANITRFDLEEWKQWYQGSSVLKPEYAKRNPAEYDILDIGYWERDGDGNEVYEPACDNTRSRSWWAE